MTRRPPVANRTDTFPYTPLFRSLLNLASRKRKDIRKERAAAVAGLEIVHLTGVEISEAHLDIFWHFYQDTGARKWGRPYLTRACFSLLVERMADRRSEEHTSELQSLMRISSAVFCVKKTTQRDHD